MYKKSYAVIILVALLIFSAIFSVGIGRISVSVGDIFAVLLSPFFDTQIVGENSEVVVKVIRGPRILIAILVSAALAISGAAYQGLFKNPIVSPDILGVSAGAGVGASIAIIYSFGAFMTQVMAFTFGIMAVFLVIALSSIVSRGRINILMMILSGIVISSLFSACTSLLKYLADAEEKLPEITFWLMGSLAKSGVEENIIIMIIVMLLGSIPLFLLRWKINVLSFGEEEAKAMGVNTKLVSLIIIFSSTLLTASSVAICGIVGWIGLVVPHIARLLVGPDFRILLPTSMLVGATFLIWVDNLARSLTASELPLGILTSVIGAPIFIFLLIRGKKGWV
ncbi:MAG: FecCD family ABC transporter permease [Campylobacteraceae bacterium]